MQTKNLALYAKSRLPWVLVALAIGALAPPAAASQTHQQGKAALGSWGTYQPKGWSAGSVTRGTGYWRPGASLRVREVQRRLNRLDYASGRVDGFFGPITDAAVRRYQLDRGLELDGIVGPQTLKDLRSRTRRVQGSADRKTSGSEPQASGSKGTPVGAPRQDAVTHRAPRQEASRSTSTPATPDRDGLDRPLPELVLLGAGFAALLLLAGVLAVQSARATRRAAARIRARVRSARGRAGDRLYQAAYVEGLSGDERIGAFRGFAYIIRPMTSGEEQGEEATSLLVYDPSKPKPVSAHLSEVTAINGQPVRSAGARGEVGTEPTPETVELSEHPATGSERFAQPVAETGRTASVTPLRPGTRESRAALQIVRRIEKTGPRARSESGTGRRDRSRSGTSRMSDLHGGRFPNRFRWLGARVYLADAEGIDHALTLPVDLELFAESESRRWETGLLEIGEPLRVSVGDFEASVRGAVVPEWLPELAAALAEGGVVIDSDELARLPFAVERSIEVERAIAGMEAVSKQAS
jgi:peptidoglycan hydrolase-like protein with peptidoglycan-binding domain